MNYIVDGSYRRAIAREFGYECPEIVRSDLTEEDARVMARALNLARRQLNTTQKRQIIADQLRETPGEICPVDRQDAGRRWQDSCQCAR